MQWLNFQRNREKSRESVEIDRSYRERKSRIDEIWIKKMDAKYGLL